jgi:hypothetical protein
LSWASGRKRRLAVERLVVSGALPKLASRRQYHLPSAPADRNSPAHWVERTQSRAQVVMFVSPCCRMY